MKYFIVLRMPLDYSSTYTLTDLDDIMQLRMFMRYECQPMGFTDSDTDTDNYDKWNNMHSNGYFPIDTNYDVLVKTNLTRDDVNECHNNLYSVISTYEDWSITDDNDESYWRCKNLDTIVNGTQYYAWQGMHVTAYSTSATPSVGDQLQTFDLDGTLTNLSSVDSVGKAFDEISTFTTELSTFNELTITLP